ncbi:phosphoribosylanthranilate isomerase [Paenibacillus sp. UNC499MF]|uniref:phosphoribosylanthranilate isomerase n=1 Tax=Paenibacillus sp. UNC499MF TaxID=1502751 RepID=UPI00089FBCDF|nr:phosphoribosylanthranilate isomerase [Paenibacillus sp. UNC499MF]SEG12161.1 phosphoribosylanthranilate isomerase [Paenibacillus sp. UNC499MF]
MGSVTRRPDVKICGLQSVEVLKSIVHFPISQIGFVFAPSRRRITPERASEMIAYLHERARQGHRVPKTVGVFVNPTRDELAEVLSVAKLDIIQFHGEESPDTCRSIKEQFGVELWKVSSIKSEEPPVNESSFSDIKYGVDGWIQRLDPYRDAVDAVLIDTFDPVYGGGSGRTFSWECIPAARKWAQSAGIPLIVAGGLNPDNVGGLIERYEIDGVDVSSGVETDGVKDIAKIAAFVERVTG